MCLNHPQTITPATVYGKNVFCETNLGAKKVGDHGCRSNTLPPFTFLWICRSSWKTDTEFLYLQELFYNAYTDQHLFNRKSVSAVNQIAAALAPQGVSETRNCVLLPHQELPTHSLRHNPATRDSQWPLIHHSEGKHAYHMCQVYAMP